MRRHAKAPSAGSIDAGGNGRGLVRRALATRGASGDSNGSGARRSGSLLAVLTLAISALALTAAPASAAPPTLTLGTVTPLYTSAHVTGTVDPGDQNITYYFQYTSDPVVEGWNIAENYKSGLPAFAGPTEVSDNFQAVGGAAIPNFGVALRPGTVYQYRLVAVNDGGDEFLSPQPYPEFTTLPVTPPVILTANPATNVTNATAEVSGSVERGTEPSDPATNIDCRAAYITDEAFGPRNEKQKLTIAATGGTYLLNFEGKTSAPIVFNANAASVRAALEALPNIGPGALIVTGGPGGSRDFPFMITFTGPLGSKNVAQISADGSAFTGPGEPPTEIETTTEGHPEGFETATETPCNHNPLIAPGTIPVTAKLTGLAPRTTYHLRLVVSNAGGSDTQIVSNFVTTAVPVVQTLGLNAIQSTSATPGARVNPQRSSATYQFQWGTTTNYGSVFPASPELLPFEDESFHLVTAPLTGLSPATTYHYRVVATSTQTGESSTGVDRTFTTLATSEGKECPNEASRVGPSAGLPDCRAYEWASPGLNGTYVSSEFDYNSQVLADGSALTFLTRDAVDNAHANETGFNRNIARRGQLGWTTQSLLPPIKAQVTTYFWSSMFQLLSDDFSQSIVLSNQPLAGAASPSDGSNYYLHRTDGTFVPLTKFGSPTYGMAKEGCCVASRDFTHLYFYAGVKQLESDPINEGNTYEWVDGDLRLVGILPGPEEEPASQGARLAGGVLPPISDDGEQVLFKASGFPGLYMRTNAEKTVEVSVSQRTVDPDPDPNAGLTPVGITGDGSELLFTSKSELTNDANTGEAEGIANHQGADLYSYDVRSESLTDLTVDNNSADAATGANVLRVLGVTNDAAYIYFVATGKLAQGASSGEQNLYVEHEGNIEFVSPLAGNPEQGYGPFDITPDGRHAAFVSVESLTGYDNNGRFELFKYTYEGGVECASCRPSGAAPTSGASVNGPIHGRMISDDGRRMFFESTDAVVPGASNGLSNVYEYENGEVHLLSPGDGKSPVRLIDASPSGDDVFLATYDELSPQGQGEISALYDARVNANVPLVSPSECQGENCRGDATSPLNLTSAGTATFEASGEISVSGVKSVKGTKTQLRVIVPGSGDITISGKGLKPVKGKASKAGSVVVTVALKPAANRTRSKTGVFKTKAEILFKSSAGDVSGSSVSLKFEASAKRMGGK